MSEALPTAAEIEHLPESLKARIARRSRQKGSGYERLVAKKLGNYFGISDWQEVAFRTAPHGHAQPQGDLKLINAVGSAWKAAGLGPIECKHRAEWSFDQIFKNATKSKIYGYWVESNERTKRDDSVIIFTKNGVSDYVFCLSDGKYLLPTLELKINDSLFIIQTLQSFLQVHFPEPQSLL